jgi:hypothetical protein
MSASRSRATAESIFIPRFMVAARHQCKYQGLLRQYFPKGSDFSRLTVEAVNQVASRINLRPRKRVDWKTPYEVYIG